MTTQDMLDDRYGRAPSTRRRWVMGIVAAVLAVLIAGFAWMVITATFDDVTATDTGYEIIDDAAIVVKFQFTAPRGSAVACALEAQDEDHGIVGWKIVEFEASQLHTRGFRETIPTVAGAATGLVKSCWVI